MNSSNPQPNHWLDLVEAATLCGSLAGSVASIIFKQFLWVTLPLSASATLAWMNHQRLKRLITSEVLKQQTVMSSLLTQNQEELEAVKTKYQTKYKSNQTAIAETVDHLEQLRNLTTTELARLNKEEASNYSKTSKEVKVIQNTIAELNQLSQNLAETLGKVEHRQKQTSKQVRELKAIDIFSQNIKAEFNTVQSYFERGFAYERLGNRHRAIEDYSKAIELASDHAQAYHHRGSLYLDLGVYQKAVIDLRKASQLYFDKGNLDKYRETRDLSQSIHQPSAEPISQQPESQPFEDGQVMVGNLFG